MAASLGLEDGDRYIPVYLPRGVELEVSQADGMMRRVQNPCQLAPISLVTWKGWASVSESEIRHASIVL